MVKKSISNENSNIYQKIPKEFLHKQHNPSFNKHKIDLPCRILICGSSGSGKTTCLMEFLQRAQKTFTRLILCVKSIDEPIYKYLLSKKGVKNMISVFEGGEVPDIDEIDNPDMDNILVVFDDLVNMKDQDTIIEYFLRCRKKNISAMYLSQSYYKCPKTIRLNCNYIILKKLGSTRDLKEILKDNSLNVEQKELLKIYEDATKDKLNFLLIDLNGDEASRFRKNFLLTYNINNFLKK